MRILVADDDPVVLRVLWVIIERLGYQVAGSARTGTEAVLKAAEVAPDLIVMDLSLPEIDGLEATRRIMASRPVPVVILTAFDDPQLVQAASNTGAGAYVVKPPQTSEIRRAIFIAKARFHDWAELKKANEELRRAIAEAKELRGLLPICSHCKKIRDDRGYWQGVEAYISAHSHAQFTHGLCHECAPIYFPGIEVEVEPGRPS